MKRTYLAYRYGGLRAAIPSLSEPFEWDRVTDTSIAALFGADDKYREILLGFHNQGHLGALVRHPDGWAAFGWVAGPGSCPPHLPRWVSRLDLHWIFYCHTAERFRGLGLYTRVLGALVSTIGANGHSLDSVFVDCAPGNVPARRAALSAGFSPVGQFDVLRLPPSQSPLVLGKWRRDARHPALNGTAS